MTAVQVLGMVAAAISGGGAFKVMDFFFNNPGNRENFQLIVTNLSKDNEDLRRRIQVLEGFAQEVHELRTKLLLMESAHYDKPIPEWLKDLNGVMLSLNPAYERDFLKPYGVNSSDYIGKMDEEIWDEATAAAFRENDRRALTSPFKWWAGYETVVTKTGHSLGVFLIFKYVRYSGTIPIGIAGLALPINLESDLQKKIFEMHEKSKQAI